jgi:xylulokinase
MGLFDLTELGWSQPILDELELDSSRLPEALPPGALLGEVTDSAAAKTGLPAGLPIYAAGGDGQCAGLGTNCTVPDRAYINLGTAVVSGIWSPEYRYNSAWRTELAAQGEGYIFENCLRSGAFLLNWFVDQFVAHGKADAAVFKRLEAAALQLPIGSDGLLVQPYFSGVMDPHWDTSARGVMLGLSGSHTEAHIYRAIIESITLDQVMRTQDMETAAEQHVSHFVAIGGGANSPLWRQMLADASGKPVHVSATVEASALGAAMIAATGVGWYSSITAAAEAMAGETTVVQPDASRCSSYRALLDIYRDLYHATADLNHRMVAFAAAQRDKPA